MRYTMKAIRESLTPDKRKSDGTMTRFLYRPLSVPASWLFLRLGLSPNAVTVLGALLCLVAFAAALFPVVACHRLAMALFLAFAVLDCADGNMARAIGKKTVYGGWFDAAGGYLAYATLLLSMGLSSFYGSSETSTLLGLDSVISVIPFRESTWILVAAVAAVANTLMRLFHQSFKNASRAAGVEAEIGAEKRFSEEIGVTGYLPLLYLAGYETGFLPFVLIAYTAVYSGGFLLSSVKLALKASKAS